jgi:proteasome lid subunit RPN8/RPN11
MESHVNCNLCEWKLIFGGFMFTRVQIKKSKLDYFRKMARKNYPLEIQTYLLGNIKSIDLIEITDIVYTKKYHVQTKSSVVWFEEDFEKVIIKSETVGKMILGDLHTHPDYESVMSNTDYVGTIKQGFSIAGICSVYGNKTRVRFWTPTSALPLKLIYT